MKNKKYLTHRDVSKAARLVAIAIDKMAREVAPKAFAVYPVPRGGVPALYAVMQHSHAANVIIADEPGFASLFVDDLIDSGATCDRYAENYPGTPFLALFSKGDEATCNSWVVFPWEQRDGGADAEGVEDNVKRILQYVGEDPARPGLLETPQRVARAWDAWTAGYHVDPATVLKTFEDGAERYDEMVVVKDIPFYSHCEHHMAPFFGTATIAYIPDRKIVGLSKLSRLLEVYARRLQVQERLTTQVAEALANHLAPRGVGVLIRARHLCMESRGVCKQGHHTVTSSLRGVLREDPAARAEFMAIAKTGG